MDSWVFCIWAAAWIDMLMTSSSQAAIKASLPRASQRVGGRGRGEGGAGRLTSMFWPLL